MAFMSPPIRATAKSIKLAALITNAKRIAFALHEKDYKTASTSIANIHTRNVFIAFNTMW